MTSLGVAHPAEELATNGTNEHEWQGDAACDYAAASRADTAWYGSMLRYALASVSQLSCTSTRCAPINWS